MTTEREGKIIRFSCDGGADRRGITCRRNYESDGDFRGAWAEAKHHGWVNSESDGTWQHYCPDCKKEYGDD